MPDRARVRAVLDAAPTVLLLGLSLAALLAPRFEAGVQFQPPGPAAGDAIAVVVPVVLAETLPLLARRRFPGVVLVVVAAAVTARNLLVFPALPGDLALFVALYAAGRHTRGRQWWLVAGYALHPGALLVVAEFRVEATPGNVLVYVLAFVLLPIGAGFAARPRRAPGSGVPGPPRQVPGGSPPLTRREREVLAMMAEGLSNREIADVLFVSPETVKTHVGRILTKLGARNRTQAALLAVEHGLLSPRP